MQIIQHNRGGPPGGPGPRGHIVQIADGLAGEAWSSVGDPWHPIAAQGEWMKVSSCSTETEPGPISMHVLVHVAGQQVFTGQVLAPEYIQTPMGGNVTFTFILLNGTGKSTYTLKGLVGTLEDLQLDDPCDPATPAPQQ